MIQQEANLFERPETVVDSAIDESTWLLSTLEVYNWGPFAGYHTAEFDGGGHGDYWADWQRQDDAG